MQTSVNSCWSISPSEFLSILLNNWSAFQSSLEALPSSLHTALTTLKLCQCQLQAANLIEDDFCLYFMRKKITFSFRKTLWCRSHQYHKHWTPISAFPQQFPWRWYRWQAWTLWIEIKGDYLFCEEGTTSHLKSIVPLLSVSKDLNMRLHKLSGLPWGKKREWRARKSAWVSWPVG